MEKELLEQLQKATKALQDTNDRAETEKKEFGATIQETKDQMDKLNSHVDELKSKLDEMATKANRRHKNSTEKSDEQIEQETKHKEAFFKFMKSGGNAGALNEKERKALSDIPMAMKALVEDSLGEIIVPEAIDNEIQFEKYKRVVMRADNLARVVTIRSNKMRRSTFNSMTAGYGKLETNVDNYDIRKFESDIVPAREWLNVFNLYALTNIGEDLLNDSEFNLTQIITQMFAEAMAYTEGYAFMNGRGDDFQEPEGLLTNKQVQRQELTSTDSTLLDGLLALQYVPKDVSARTNGVYIVNSKTELYTRTQKDENGNYMWQPPVQAGKPATLFGKSVYVDDSIGGKNAAVFGDIKKAYTIVDRQGMTIRRYDQAQSALENDLIPFRAKARNGGGVTRAQAVAILQADVPDLGGVLKPATP